ncbi:hypothetical protein QQX98_009951 [Neonectria punicea]|uniref:PD-(D/E)XK nuclease-like domain-containing protein n=1 Tax=Neonectria punicea TaxID=979145 RepID=A0ABR1GQV9_9HYPO
MLVVPDTLRITAVLDLEFTNAMPSQYSSEPPWWLLLTGPDSYLFRGRTTEEFVTAYEPRLEQFLQAMRRAEGSRGTPHNEEPLSSLIRDSWATKRFWFNYAARKPFIIEALFDNRLNEGSAGVELMDEEIRTRLELFSHSIAVSTMAVITPAYGRPSPSKRVDFCIYIESENDESSSATPATSIRSAIGSLRDTLPGRILTFTDFATLDQRPIALNIETKKSSEGFDNAKLQLGVWQMAH